MMSANFDSDDKALTFGTLLVMPIVLFGGGFSNPKVSPAAIVWLRWFSPIYYAYGGLNKI